MSGGAGHSGGSPFQPAEKPPLLDRTVPVTAELPRYRARHARRALLAGVTVAP